MKNCKITVLKKVEHLDLISAYEAPLVLPCSLNVGDTFISYKGEIPVGFCQQAWQSLYPYVFALANGTEAFFDGWMKNKGCAMISCNDGFRPVTFYIEVINR